ARRVPAGRLGWRGPPDLAGPPGGVGPSAPRPSDPPPLSLLLGRQWKRPSWVGWIGTVGPGSGSAVEPGSFAPAALGVGPQAARFSALLISESSQAVLP